MGELVIDNKIIFGIGDVVLQGKPHVSQFDLLKPALWTTTKWTPPTVFEGAVSPPLKKKKKNNNNNALVSIKRERDSAHDDANNNDDDVLRPWV